MEFTNELDDTIFNCVWTKKYAPVDIDDMVLTDENRTLINQFIEKEDTPSLLLVGAPGQGKTTLATLLCKKINATTLIYNASMDTGIDTIRNRVKNFVESMSETGSLKVVILDEADRLSAQAQDSLKVLIEDNAAHTRFILTANEGSRITAPLKSRLMPLNITPPKAAYIKYITSILKKESIVVTMDDIMLLKDLLNECYPDLRRGIMTIQRSVVNGKLQIKPLMSTDGFIQQLYDAFSESDPIEMRKIWIENESEFSGDYQYLLKQMHEFFYKKEDIGPSDRADILLCIFNGIKNSSLVLDQEINFYATMLECRKLVSNL